MENGHKIEIFIAGCFLCERAIKKVKEIMCPKCTLEIYNILTKCEDLKCIRKAEKYNIKAIPTIIIDDKIKIEGEPSLKTIEEALKI